MTDIHSHVLPQVDDGSRSTAESLSMLEAMSKQGIARVAATPHFYPSEDSPERFLERRAAAADRLREEWRPDLPQLMLGAEVYYFEGISRAEGLDALRLEGTPILLLEMPFRPWTPRMTDEILELHGQHGTTVLLAHIERYLRFQKPEIWDVLLEAGVRMQCNASFLLNWKSRWKALRMFREGRIHLLGSDSHNMTSRPPRLGEALKVLGPAGREILEGNIRQFIPEPEEAAD